MSLADLQALFWQAVRQAAPPAGLAQTFVHRGALNATRRMEIYRSAYWARHEQCLKESYPRLLADLGEQRFRALVAHYIAAHPSQVPCIERAGQALPGHLRQHARDLGLDAVLADVAELEWARIAAWLAPDAGHRLTRAELATAGPARPLRTDPSLQLVHVQARALTSMPEGAQTGDEPCWVVTWRAQSTVRWLLLAPDEWRALQRAQAEAPLAEACAQFEGPEAGVRAATALSAWLRRGWLLRWEKCDEAT